MDGRVGNQFWKMRSSHGKKPTFEDPDVLWAACEEYFEWVEANPLQEEKVFPYQGEITRTTVSKMRAMTIEGLHIFLGISRQTWYRMKEKDAFQDTIEQIERVIRDQKFTGAAAELLNANIIARDLGLKDSHEHTGKDGGTLQTVVILPAKNEVGA